MAPFIRQFVLFMKIVCIIYLSADVEIENSKLGNIYISNFNNLGFKFHFQKSISKSVNYF